MKQSKDSKPKRFSVGDNYISPTGHICMMKKYLLCLTVLLFPALAQAYDACINGIYYNLTSSYERVATVTYGDNPDYSGNVTIPEEVEYYGLTYKVKYIQSYAFRGCNGLTSVSIPGNMISIGSSAFSGCNALTKVAFRGSQNSGIILGSLPIGTNAFESCPLQSVTLGRSVDYSFKNMTSLTSLTITPFVTSIGDNAFSGCSGLTSLWLPDGYLKSIGSSAFSGCSGLTSLTIPNNVTSIGEGAFSYCI